MDQDLQGKIGRFTLPEIFQLIAAGRKSGTLGIQKDDDIVMVYFRKGRIIYGYGPRQTYHLGELLREKGRLTSGQLDDAVRIQAQSESSKRLGRILIEKGYIRKEDLEATVRTQVEELIYSLLVWESGSFKFYENQYPTEEEITVDISVENAVLEGLRRADEASRTRGSLPDTDAVLILAPAAAGKSTEVALQAEEWNLLALVNGRRTVAEIAAHSGLEESAALRLLASLKLAGLISTIDRKEEEADNLAGMVDRLTILLEEYIAGKARKIDSGRTIVQAIKEQEISTGNHPEEI